MTTALQIITKAMKKVGILTKTEMPDADEANDALDALNMMLSSWSNDSVLTFARVWESFPLTANVGEYTIGVGQMFNTTRPIGIDAAYIRQATTDYPMVGITDEDYNLAIYNKNVASIPEAWNYDNGYPVGRIRLWPVPVASYTMFILSEKELTQFTQLNQIVILPPGWERALVYNLAVELAPEYGQEIPASTQNIANTSKGAIQRAILKVRTMDVPPNFSGRRRDILSDRT